MIQNLTSTRRLLWNVLNAMIRDNWELTESKNTDSYILTKDGIRINISIEHIGTIGVEYEEYKI